MPKPVESSCEREARRVYKELGLGTDTERNSFLRGLGADPTDEEPSPGYEIRISHNSDALPSKDLDAELERTSR